jgi:hypothetical protein
MYAFYMHHSVALGCKEGDGEGNFGLMDFVVPGGRGRVGHVS